MPTVDTNQELTHSIISLYQRYFGSVMADSYATFYANKDTKTILTSAEELVTEYAGEAKGKEILSDIYKKYNIKPN